MTMTKGKAFLICLILIMVIFLCAFALTAAKGWDLSVIHIGEFLTALCLVTGGYVGFQVANNGVKGRFFNEGLYDRENPKGEE